MPQVVLAANASVAESNPVRRSVALVIGGFTGIFVFAIAAGLTESRVLCALSATVAAAIAGRRQWRRPTVAVDATGCSRAWILTGLAASILALALIFRLSVFMIDSERTGYSAVPWSDWEIRHSCLTAYFVAAGVVRRTPNVYDPSLYAAPGDDPRKPRMPQTMGLFRVDQYEYPPPFLLAPRLISLAVPGFLRLRSAWFGLSGLALLAGLLAAARAMAPRAGTRALLLAPIVLGSLSVINTLQKGNVQIVVIALSVLAMAEIERKRRPLGGAVLAFVTVSKLYPGLLVVYLLARRDWRAVAWTAVFSVIFVALTIADVGWQPFAAFRQHLPGLMSGEAFPAFRNPAAVAINLSIPGLLFKLKLFGLADFGFDAAGRLGTLYMVGALVITVALARRVPAEDRTGPLIWVTVLLLATLRSPFLPWSYATFPALWLLTLLAAADVPRPWALAPFLGAAALLSIVLAVDSPLDPRVKVLASAVPMVLMLVLPAVVILRTDAATRRSHALT